MSSRPYCVGSIVTHKIVGRFSTAADAARRVSASDDLVAFHESGAADLGMTEGGSPGILPMSDSEGVLRRTVAASVRGRSKRVAASPRDLTDREYEAIYGDLRLLAHLLYGGEP